jgi:uncharacterized protein YegJ (DUF2314 family)
MTARTPIQPFVVLGCLAVSIGALGCKPTEAGRTVVSREGEPDLVRSKDDPLLKRAVQKARATHQEFVAALTNPQPDFRDFAIKKGFERPGGGLEHMWITDVRWENGAFHGIVNNEPVDTQAVKLGDAVTVTPEELSDWMYLDGRQLMGGYTIRVLFSQASPAQQAELKADMDIPPVDF